MLNVLSKFDAMVVNSMPSYTTHHDLDLPPSIEEVVSAVHKMDGGTAGGSSGLVPEMLMYGVVLSLTVFMRCFRRCGRGVPLSATGEMQRSSPSLRKVTCAFAITGAESVFWMLSASCSLGSFKIAFKLLPNLSYQTCSAVSAREGDVLT